MTVSAKWYDERVQEMIPKSIDRSDSSCAHFVLRWLREGVNVAREYGRTMAPTAYGNLKKGGFVMGNKLLLEDLDSETWLLLLILGARGYVMRSSVERKE